MNIPFGTTEYDLEVCKNIASEYVKEEDMDRIALELLNLVYAKGGDYSEKTLRAFAESYLKK